MSFFFSTSPIFRTLRSARNIVEYHSCDKSITPFSNIVHSLLAFPSFVPFLPAAIPTRLGFITSEGLSRCCL